MRSGGRGDQFVTVRVTVPKGMTSAQKEALRGFAATLGETIEPKSGVFGKRKK